MTARKVHKDLAAFLMYAFGFMLIWEWLRPLDQLTDTSYLWVFLIFLIISLLLSFFSVSIILSLFIKCLYILYALHFLYFEGAFFQTGWIPLFVREFLENLSVIFAGDWPSLTNLFKSFLLFILLSIMTYLIQYWLINRRQIFIFLFMTLIYITVLDTFTPYDAGAAIVRTVVLGFAVMGMLTFYRLLDKEMFKKDFSLSRKWMTPLVILIALSTGLGLAAPKADPIWPDPVPFIVSHDQNSGDDGPGIQKMGYGEDDTQLGGPFIGDDQVVFTAEVESRHYWKVETKDVYTGKGWTTSQSRADKIPFLMEDVPISSFVHNEGVETAQSTSTVFTVLEYPHLVYPLGIQSIEAAPFTMYELETATEKIRTLEAGNPVSLDHYQLTYEVPKYSVTALRSAGLKEYEAFEGAFISRYTQLPEDLPPRVQELALEITEGKTNWFDQARELESYFRRSGFTYDQKNAAVPGEDDDYVDQFLFETKIGYCDNFSTSMVVMARSIGIPARWVKGYTEGEYKTAQGSLQSFEVTNNNAHSWVEVFFPNVGWVSFEPTQGFSNNVQFNFDDASTNTNTAEPEEPKEKENPVKPDQPEEKPKETSSFSFKKLMESMQGFWDENWKWIGLAFLAAGIGAFAIYQKRGRWIPYYFVWRFKRTTKDDYFPKAYIILLKELERYGLKRKDGQTLRDYANYVDSFFSTREMSRLTARYEQLVYRGVLQEGSWEETKELWENLIKKTIA